MDLELFLSTIFKVATGIVFTGLTASLTAIALFWSWKMASNLIRHHKKYANKIRKATVKFDRSEIKVVKNGKKAAAK